MVMEGGSTCSPCWKGYRPEITFKICFLRHKGGKLPSLLPHALSSVSSLVLDPPRAQGSVGPVNPMEGQTMRFPSNRSSHRNIASPVTSIYTRINIRVPTCKHVRRDRERTSSSLKTENNRNTACFFQQLAPWGSL